MAEPDQVQGLPKLFSYNAFLITASLFLGLLLLESILDKNALSAIGILLVLAIGLLVSSADFFIAGARSLAKRAGVAEVVIGLTVVSIGTSLPEILVTASAAYDIPTSSGDVADLAVGSIFGSVLVQITLILGIVALTRPIRVGPKWLRRDGMLMLGANVLLGILIWTGTTLGRVEGGFLVLAYVWYVVWLVRHRKEIQEDAREQGLEPQAGEAMSLWSTGASIVMVILGLGFALFAAHHLVDLAVQVAQKLSVSEAVIGTTISGIGTSLPELTIALLSVKKSEGVAIGTLVGSNITDPTLSIGIAALIHPLEVSSGGWVITSGLIIPATIVSIGVALLFMRTNYRFRRREGAMLISLYLVFLALLALQRNGIILAT